MSGTTDNNKYWVSGERWKEILGTLKGAFWSIVNTVQITLADVAVTGDFDDLSNKPTLDNAPTANSDNGVKSGGVKAALDAKQDTLTFDNAATKNSTNAIKSGAVYDAAHPAVVNHGTSDTTFALTPNVFHIWGEVASLTLTLVTPSDNTVENEYKFRFVSGSTATTISLPSSVVYDESKGDLIPEADKIYEVSIQDNIAVWISIDNS